VDLRTLKFEILAATSDTNRVHKYALIGRGSDRGDLERRLSVTFEPSVREAADLAFQELKAAGLIRSTYSDLIDPDAWVAITEAGRTALARRCLDALDEALQRIGVHLVELRDGAWAAIASSRPDSLRQAAHSARELVEQTLKLGAPDDTVRTMPDFQSTAGRSEISRRQRLRCLMSARGSLSDADLNVAEKACELVLAVDKRLQGYAHARETPTVADV
jgi:hypothetical protein